MWNGRMCMEFNWNFPLMTETNYTVGCTHKSIAMA